ncbi:MAG: WalW protein [Sphingomonas sp.]|uniref:polysaccharide deacetylase family protein n=1 Tax=Sphingomonas sp. TaxID=28214 RepID=UPI000DB23995|nr:WalW protein [Sphingomonas sp.]PZP20187.1 MAG: WalW protein [Sphingomonas hengshuiensis]
MQGASPLALQPSTPIVWPDEFGTRFTIFVDTEEEFDWRASFSRDRHGTSAMAALPAAHARFADRGVPIVYLVDYPVASDPRACDALRAVLADSRSEIGTQLHPWVNPPFDEALAPHNSYAGNLPEALEAAKIDALTDVIVRSFGQRPRVYRTGRYGIGPATWRLLAERGYRIDSSIRARYDYQSDGGPDFAAIGNAAFRCGPDGALIALPLTTVYTGILRRLGEPFFRALGQLPRGRGAAARLGLMSRVSLTPEGMPIADALEAVRVAVGEGERLLNFAFHSPSLAPGHTPYVRDARDLAAFHAWWDQVLELLVTLGVRPVTVDQLLDAA